MAKAPPEAPPTLAAVQARIRSLADPEAARVSARYFKTGPGEYGESDVFLGLRAPALRALAKEFAALPRADALRLLRSPLHEERLLALLVLVRRYPKSDAAERRAIFDGYLASTAYINNWDLVDLTAEHIVGAQLWEADRGLLSTLAGSPSVWERRIAILSTFHFIRRGDFATTFAIAELLLGDRHDLIHKGVGWMLREVANRDRAAAEAFLRRHYRQMPRTMLRYAIERFPEDLRQGYLRGTVE